MSPVGQWGHPLAPLPLPTGEEHRRIKSESQEIKIGCGKRLRLWMCRVGENCAEYLRAGAYSHPPYSYEPEGWGFSAVADSERTLAFVQTRHTQCNFLLWGNGWAQAMICPAAMWTNFSVGLLGFSCLSRWRRGISFTKRRAEPRVVFSISASAASLRCPNEARVI